MSHTVSRGLHDARRWLVPALVVEDGLRNGTDISRGSLSAMEQFFLWSLEGIAQGERPGMRDRSIPAMGPICAFSIAYEIQVALGKNTASLSQMRSEMEKYRNILSGINKPTSEEIADLQAFLAELIRQGDPGLVLA